MNLKSQYQSRKSPGSRGFWDLVPTPVWYPKIKLRLGAPRNYVHRVGRTARAGRKGLSITMVSPYDTQRVIAIEKLVNSTLTEFPLEEDKIIKILVRKFS